MVVVVVVVDVRSGVMVERQDDVVGGVSVYVIVLMFMVMVMMLLLPCRFGLLFFSGPTFPPQSSKSKTKEQLRGSCTCSS